MIIDINDKYTALHNYRLTCHPLALETLINPFFSANIPYIINK
jgi:hypothetical protein